MSARYFLSDRDLIWLDNAFRGDLGHVIVSAAGAAVCAHLHEIPSAIELQITEDQCYAYIHDTEIDRIGDSMRYAGSYAVHSSPYDGPPRLVKWQIDDDDAKNYERVELAEYWPAVAQTSREIVDDLLRRLHFQYQQLRNADRRVREIERAVAEMHAVHQLVETEVVE